MTGPQCGSGEGTGDLGLALARLRLRELTPAAPCREYRPFQAHRLVPVPRRSTLWSP
jgi:hypothetical protein